MKDIAIELDKSSKVKLYHQLYQFFVDMIESGELPLGTKLPSIRNLSEDYKISRNTVTKAYSELEKDGYIYSPVKSGFFVKNPNEASPSDSNEVKSSPVEAEEDSEIPTVNSILKNSTAETLSSSVEGSELMLTNMDAISAPRSKKETIILKDSLSNDEVQSPSMTNSIPSESNKEHSIIMNSGDVFSAAVMTFPQTGQT